MRTILIVLMLLPWVVEVLAAFLLFFQLRAFQRSTPALNSRADMDRFKRLAAFQMRTTEILLPLMAVPLLVWVCGKFFGNALTWADLFLFGILPVLVPFACSSAMIGTARAVRATPAPDAAMASERDRVATCGSTRNARRGDRGRAAMPNRSEDAEIGDGGRLVRTERVANRVEQQHPVPGYGGLTSWD